MLSLLSSAEVARHQARLLEAERSIEPLVRKRLWLQGLFRVPLYFVAKDGGTTTGELVWRWTSEEARKLDEILAGMIEKVWKEAASMSGGRP